MEKKTIIYIGGFELPDKNAAAHRVLNNGKVLEKLGYNIVFIDCDRTLKWGTDWKDTLKNVQGFECYSVPYPSNNIENFNYFYSIKNLVDIIKLYQNVESVICYNYQSAALLRLMRFGKKNNIKIIADSTEGYELSFSKNFVKTAKAIDDYIRIKYLQPNLDGVIVISSFLYNYYSQVKNKIRIPPLVDKKEGKWAPIIEGEVKSPKLNLIYSGNMGSSKDKIDKIIQFIATRKLQYEINFKIIGISKDEYIGKYPDQKSIIKKMEHSIHFMGKVSHSVALEHLKKSDFLIFFRDINLVSSMGFPTKFVEGISAGVPIITNLSSDIEEYLIDGKNGFAVSESVLEDLERIFEMPLSELKDIKNTVENSLFDYKNFISPMKGFIDSL
ncbi:glycosyltransferase [Sutcliffiella halmapala]